MLLPYLQECEQNIFISYTGIKNEKVKQLFLSEFTV